MFRRLPPFLWLTLSLSSASALAAQDEHPPVASVMARLADEYGAKDKKYDALAKKIAKEVDKALSEQTWSSAGGEELPLAEHPYFLWIEELGAAARAATAKKNSPTAKALLEQFPWDTQLELVLGLEHGSDRAVPDHDAGFIHLGLSEGSPGYPDITGNQYLYGLRELVGWQYAIKPGKKPSFEGRGPKDGPELATELPGWEQIRIYLQGSVPDVSLYAVPWMTHRIHARLAERRGEASEVEARMDATLALLDSKWNGFTFETPYTKSPTPFAQPVHAVFTERGGFVYQFPPSERLANSGDIPFVSVTTYGQYADVFRSERLGPSDFISRTPEASACMDQFSADSNYLARYRKLIAELVFAVLAPNEPYPSFLAYLDYPDGTPPSARERHGQFDTPRKHALLVWAYCEKDLDRVADYLYDNVLSQNAFPGDAVLPNELTRVVRAADTELVGAIAAAVERERAAAGGPGNFAREFSPHAEYLAGEGDTASDFVVHSFHSFHAAATDAVRAAAYAVVSAELGE